MPDPIEIDLPSRDWTSDRPKPRQPFFGRGAPGALAYVIGYAISATVVYWLVH